MVCDMPTKPRRIVIAGGSPGGVYHALAAALAKEIGELPDYRPEAWETSGSVENLTALAEGRADIGFASVDAAVLAITGRPPFGEKRELSALARVHDDYLHVVVRSDSPALRLEDLRGMRVSTGAPQSGTELLSRRLLDLAAIGPGDISVSRLDITDSAEALRDGGIDAFFFSSGLPNPAIKKLAGEVPIRILPMDTYIDRIRAAYPFVYTKLSMPAGLYGQNVSIPTIGIRNLLIVRRDTPVEVAHDLTRVLFQESAELSRAHPEALRIDERLAIATTPVGLHAGAVRYYREVKEAITGF
ncbi:TAXI family TRAP transporter solute-binding subunit [Spongiactinospora sp. TRM90649]|uniref:TAXI family TRAP transporter solute-binding subunit n=1 Tax=Spongiactinospora sp. TRM90649 TaxID=3031114 RepID=UPI0023F7C208|nr:TAXI family TRAP transporter solute-binding subunit [Spongiactinospora sp. TRM90649]MDF5756335.1 TAXI family TRAP transporter solute-binding subunit [Spongiactinospora sp. TRM90649]